MKKNIVLMTFIVVIVSTTLISSCGQKGPLYIPQSALQNAFSK